MYQLLDLFKSPDPIVLNFKMQLKCSFIVKKGSSFRSQACCHWGVNFQFKHIEHIESKSNFLYEPHHSHHRHHHSHHHHHQNHCHRRDHNSHHTPKFCWVGITRTFFEQHLLRVSMSGPHRPYLWKKSLELSCILWEYFYLFLKCNWVIFVFCQNFPVFSIFALLAIFSPCLE